MNKSNFNFSYLYMHCICLINRKIKFSSSIHPSYMHKLLLFPCLYLIFYFIMNKRYSYKLQILFISRTKYSNNYK